MWSKQTPYSVLLQSRTHRIAAHVVACLRVCTKCRLTFSLHAVSVTFDCCRRLGRRFHRRRTYIFCCISAVNTHKYCPGMCSCLFILLEVCSTSTMLTTFHRFLILFSLLLHSVYHFLCLCAVKWCGVVYLYLICDALVSVFVIVLVCVVIVALPFTEHALGLCEYARSRLADCERKCKKKTAKR